MVGVVHDQSLLLTEARLSIDVGIAKRFGASLVLPVRSVNTEIRYIDGAGSEVRLVREGIHHRNQTLTGLADPMLLGAYVHAIGPVRVTGRAGFTIPIGRTEEDPFVMADEAHEHMQFGTGTVNPVLALDASYAWDRWHAGGFVFTQQALYENGKGYQAGDRYAAGVALRRALGDFGVRGGVELQAETAERWGGIVHTDEGNQGRFDAMAVAGGSWRATDALAIDVNVKVPFVTRVEGGQLDMPAILEVGASWTFGAKPRAKPEAPHEHEGEHAHDAHDHDEHGPDEHAHADHADHADHAHDEHAHADTTGLDVAELGKPGDAPDLAPVPGKLTIFDFWATWCEPCKTLDPALVELVRAHPDQLALRKIDVVDWDSKAAARYLTPGGHNLPHVKIVDGKGKTLFEKSPETGKLAAYIDEIRALVERHTSGTPVADKPPARPAAKPRVIAIEANAKGYTPANVTVKRGAPVTLRFSRTTAKTCATEVVLEHDGKKIVKDLPLGTPVDLTLTFAKPGTVKYACAMNMLVGTITVE